MSIYTDLLKKLSLGDLASLDLADLGDLAQVDLADLVISREQIDWGIRTISADGAVVIGAADACIILDASETGAKAITHNGCYAGQQVSLRLAARSGGSYTLEVAGGTLTIDAANEGTIVVRNGANSAWLVAQLFGATVV